MVHERVIDFEQATVILADDTSPKGMTFLESFDEKHWRIILPGEYFFITVSTLRKLAEEQKITANPDQKNLFYPTKT